MYLLFGLFALLFGLMIGGKVDHICNRLIHNNLHSTSTLRVRLLLGATFGILGFFYEFSTEWIIALPFVLTAVMVTITDLRQKIIPDIIILPGILFLTLIRIFIHPLPYWNYLFAALIGAGIFYLIALICYKENRAPVIGGGDIKLLFLTGLVLGIQLSLLSFLLFCFMGTFAALYLLIIGGYKKDTTIPFGPFITAASFISYIWGDNLYHMIYWAAFY
ncbi:prepilin peptidase [Bacillus sp. FJAT-28004]|uniref:prepilin peptidase n=1 Tax=Bacillus sp. FJAT-28004 TaxID=1679165 RepID=UPI0006B4CE2D|nr:A24 family peptidase [Bacillus sp. FJAT-28004]